MALKVVRKNEYELEIPRQNKMHVAATVYASDRITLENSALQQLADGASMHGVKRVLATPDIHHGFGVPIGSVIGLSNYISPAAVGYDINCGMRMLRTDKYAADVCVDRLATAVKRYIPLGEGKSNISLTRSALEAVLINGVPALAEIKNSNQPVWEMVDKESLSIDCQRIEDGGSMPGNPERLSQKAFGRGANQLGTLGGGNHFIEFQKVDQIFDSMVARRFGIFEGQLVIMIHSGSRGLGHQIGDEYMKLARQKTGERQVVPALELSTREGASYWSAMNAAANFAFANRHIMGLLASRAISEIYPDSHPQLVYDVPHNIAKKEHHNGLNLIVHRKGATRAFGPLRMKGTSFADTGQPVLIPGSMGTASFLLSGMDTKLLSLGSVNHGAGRVMGRIQARGKWKRKKLVRPAAISDQQFKQAMEGVFLLCENQKTIKEEAPQAYKDIDIVMETVTGARLGNRVARMKPLGVLKG